MSVQQFCLRWNNHQPNFISVFSSLLHNEALVDVTLAAEGKQLQAHKVVLSACSSYFQTLFTTNPCQHPIVILKDVHYNDLKTMVDFMYYGEVNVSQEQLPHILKTAEMLKIKGLAEMPESLTKSDNKSSDQTDQTNTGNGGDTLWGSNESQPQYLHHQTQQRKSPSPVAGMSPSARRKRLRKPSTERLTDEHGSIIEGHTGLKSSKESVDMDTGHQDVTHETIDDSSSHQVQQIIPMAMSGSPATPTNSDPSTSTTHISHHQQHTSMTTTTLTEQSLQSTESIGIKRSRLLTRQSRIKRDSDPTQNVITEDDDNGHHTYSMTRLLNISQPKIERHASEPAPNTIPSSPQLLTVPQSYLLKQHSHPLLVSQSLSADIPSTCPPASVGLHRQLSYPLPESIESSSLGTQFIIKPSMVSMASSGTASTTDMCTVKTESDQYEVDTITIVDQQKSQRTSPSIVVVSEHGSALLNPDVQHTQKVRMKPAKSEELHRSASTPLVQRELSIESRSKHCPVVRSGPALGCNFCWNTIDAHGRILRRKTKYHCPECQTNLCIVPCFQSYHEQQNSAQSGSAGGSGGDKPSSSSSSGPKSLRHQPKLSSF